MSCVGSLIAKIPYGLSQSAVGLTLSYPRQQEIMNRLLEAENAERERELDEKRTSSAPKNEIYSNPDKFLAYKSQKMKEAEMLKTIPAGLQPFYKTKINKYYNTLNK